MAPLLRLCPTRFYCLLLLLAADIFSGVHTYRAGFRFVAPCYARRLAELAGKQVQLLRLRNCGENLCWCDGRTADCSGHWGNLTHVPRLPDNVVEVDLSCNNLSSEFLTMEMAYNLTQVNKLQLSHNNITWLPGDFFGEMQLLVMLTLDGNEALDVSSLTEILNNMRVLSFLSATGCNLPPLSLENTCLLRVVRLDSNPHCGAYDLGGLCPLHLLAKLYLVECDFSDVISTCLLTKLYYLDLSGNGLRRFPKTCSEKTKASLYPKLESFYLKGNRIEELSISQVCLPSLMLLDMSSNFISVYPTGSFNLVNFPVLNTLTLVDMSFNFIPVYPSGSLNYIELDVPKLNNQLTAIGVMRNFSIEDNAFDHPHLKHLHLDMNQLHFAERNISTNAFTNCSGLQSLTLDSNSLLNVDDERFLLLFGHLHSLKTLSMANTMLEIVTTKTFTNFPNLSTLILNGNIISEIPDGAFDALLKLKYLSLHNNKIKSISENTFGHDLRTRLKGLRLYYNPFVCSCDIRWFQHWFFVENQQLDGYEGINSSAGAKNYKCQNIVGTSVADFHLSDQACLLSREVSLFVIQSCSVVILALTSFCLVFRFRWHLRLLLYEAFRGRDVLRRQRLMENDFAFDVFVSYAAEDLPWVREHLMARLEGELGLRLCLHQRDFIPGHHIVDNIVQSVESSKKVLMVFSRDFVLSPWCQFELSFCLTHVMDYDDALIVVCVDDVTTRQMTSSMMAVLKTTTYIQWEEGQPDAVASFWGRLQMALQEILPQRLPQREHYV